MNEKRIANKARKYKPSTHTLGAHSFLYLYSWEGVVDLQVTPHHWLMFLKEGDQFHADYLSF